MSTKIKWSVLGIVRVWVLFCLVCLTQQVQVAILDGKDVSPGSRGITKTSAQVLAADTMTSPVLSKKKT